MLIGDFDAADTESPLGPLKDKTESVSVNSFESKNHAYFMPRLNSEDFSKFFGVSWVMKIAPHGVWATPD